MASIFIVIWGFIYFNETDKAEMIYGVQYIYALHFPKFKLLGDETIRNLTEKFSVSCFHCKLCQEVEILIILY